MKFCKVASQENPQQSYQDENIPPANPTVCSSSQATCSKLSLTPMPSCTTSEESAYEQEILQHLRQLCPQPSSPHNYFIYQPDITQHMRAVLINWLVDVHLKYKLKTETFFVSVGIIDQFLKKEAISRNELQLVGITAMWMAAKYEQTYQVPKLSNLVFICDSTYSQNQILEMQGRILLAISFQFQNINPYTYFQAFNRYSPLTAKDYYLARYLIQAICFDINLQMYPPTVIAFALIFFIRKLRNSSSTVEQLELMRMFKLQEKDIKPCARDICGLWRNIEYMESMASLRNKFMSKQFMEVAKIKISEKAK